MSVIGIDIGNENSYIAVARAGGIETIANEYSQRATPSYIAFGEKTRDLGVSAKNKQITNLKNTIFCFKRLLGKKYRESAVASELQHVPYNICELKPSGDVGFQVSYLGESTTLTAQQIMAMFLTKLKEISESNLRIKVTDCVISVPIYYNDAERRALLDSAEIAGLNVLRLLNETTAVALAYGFYQTDLDDEKPKNVVFVDLGNSAFQVTACAFTKGKLKILGTAFDRHLGGRDFDYRLVHHFVEDFNARYKLDIMKNKRAVMRLFTECEKLKKQMSANSLVLPLNIECFMNDIDVSGKMKREDFENMCSDLLTNIENTLRRLLQDVRLKVEDIDSVQLIGGSTRIPAVKALVQKVFKKEPSTTLNQDEAVARGAALQCAMLSPTFKVRDFSITDVQPYAIKLAWKAAKSEDSEMEVFPYLHPVPFSKLLTFYRSEPFTVEASYVMKDEKPNFTSRAEIGSFTIQNVTPNQDGESTKVKVKARINLHGIFSICSASMLEKQIINSEPDCALINEKTTSPKKSKKRSEAKENETKEEAMESENAEVAANGDINATENNEEKNEAQEPVKKDAEQKKSKNAVKAVELPIKAVVPQLSRNELNDFIEKEAKMIMQDKMEKEKADAKNAVEEYVYEMRGKLCEELEKFISDEAREKFKLFLEETESWLYDEGEDQQKSVYVQRLNDLKKLGDPVVHRYNEWEQRPVALNEFGRTLQLVHKALQSYAAKEEHLAHLQEEEMVKVGKLWEEKDKWIGQYLGTLANLKQHEDPPILASQIRQERENFESQVKPILSKPKPKVEPPPAADEKTSNVDQSQTDSEMKDTSNGSEKPETEPTDKAENRSQPETMEIN
ncbi:97 kDa heat shock protein-like [Uloborus diversus]|uniref:97 kDa heat shock protein-like n=1 Tax=Uloborus diversus TaxID=327109 RepID=UPI002409BF2F|nr:97 kDa heat shock protein-like [Uloborus diversus]XP_054709777.1 97 kDa heat shock protein-like [Uloborus diversus]